MKKTKFHECNVSVTIMDRDEYLLERVGRQYSDTMVFGIKNSSKFPIEADVIYYSFQYLFGCNKELE